MRSGCKLLIIISFVLINGISNIITAAQPNTVNIGGDSHYLIGTTSTFIRTAEPISIDSALVLFDLYSQSIKKERPVFGYTNDNIWIKTTLKNTGDRPFLGVYFAGYALLKYVDAYVFENDSLLVTYHSGDGYPYHERSFNSNDINFRLDLLPGQTKTYILRVTSSNTLALRLEIFSANEYLYKSGLENLIFGVLYGILLFAILYNVVIYLVAKQRSYLFYVLSMFFYFCVIITLQGYLFRFIYPEIIDISPYLHKFFMYLTSIFYLLLTIDLLETKRITPFLHKLLNGILVIYAVGIILLLTGFLAIATQIIIGSQLVVIPLVLITAFITYFKGLNEAKYFIIARSLLLVAIILNFLTSIGFVDYNPLLTQSHIGAAALEAVLLSFAIADRIKKITLENEKIKRTNLVVKMRADEAEYNAKTAELQAKAAELQAKAAEEESARKSIELDRAKEIQLAMLPKFPPFHKKFDISAKMRTASEVGGDYYDFFETSNGIIAAFGDASGHGLPAGIMVTITKTGLYFSDVENLSETMNRLNNELRKLRPKRLNMAMSMLKFYNDSDEIEYATAAMPPLFHYTNKYTKIVEYLEPQVPLGTLSNSIHSTMKITNVKIGDILLLLSDGIVEARNSSDEEFGYDRIHKIVQNAAQKSSDEIIDDLFTGVYNYLGHDELEDDISLLVLKRT